MADITRVARGLIMVMLFLDLDGNAQSIVDSKQACLNAAREIMLNAGNCALITIDKKGVPQIRTMDPFEPEPDFTVWLATNPNSRKVEQIRRNPSVSLYYADQDENGYVMVRGRATLVNDQQEKDKRWKEEWQAFYPNRSNQYLLIKVVPEYLEVINYSRGISGDAKTWQPVRVAFK